MENLTENTSSQFDIIAFSQSILAQTQQEISALHNPPCRQCSEENIVAYASYIIAGILSLPYSTLYVALTLQDPDLPSTARWPTAISEGLLILVQSIAVTQIALTRYYNYVKQLIRTPRPSTHPRKLILFILREAVKWTILSFSYGLPISLVEEIPYLNNRDFINYLIISTIFATEPAIHDLVHDYQPMCTRQQIICQERKKLRELFYQFISRASYDMQDQIHTHAAQQLYEWVTVLSDVTQDDLVHVWRILFSNSRYEKPRESYRNCYIKYIAITTLLITLGVTSSAASYRSIWNSDKISLVNATGSTICDVCFELFLALRAAHYLVFPLHGRPLKFLKHEWRKIFIVIGGLLLTVPSIFSAIAVGRYEHMSFFVGVILTSLGTLFDQSYFVIESGIKLQTEYVLRHGAHSPQQKRAIIAKLYNKILAAMENLSNVEFMQWLQMIYEQQPHIFEANLELLHDQFPYTTGLSWTEVITLFQHEDKHFFAIINQHNQFGLRRIALEYLASLVAMIPVAINCAVLQYKALPYPRYTEYLLPTLSVPLGIGFIKAADYHKTPQQSSSASIWQHTMAVLKFALYTACPAGIYYLTKMASTWAAVHIFQQSPEQAEPESTLAANAITGLSIGVIMKKIGKRMRFINNVEQQPAINYSHVA